MKSKILIIELEPNGHHFTMYLKSILEKIDDKNEIILITSKRGTKHEFIKKIKKKININIEVIKDINTFNFPIKSIKIFANQFFNYINLKKKIFFLKKKNKFNHIFFNTLDDYFLPLAILGLPFDNYYSAIYNNPDFSKKKNFLKNFFILIKIYLFNLLIKKKFLYKIYFNNFLVYKNIKKKIEFKNKIDWFYEPIKFNSKSLSINKNKIILVYGAIKKSKAIKELLNIYKNKKFEKNNYKVFVVGKQYKDIINYLSSGYCRNLIKQKKLYIKNKFISTHEEKIYFKNSFLVWTAYENIFMNSSGVYFTALKYYKPVISNKIGYLSYLTKKFKLGELVNIHNTSSIIKSFKKFENETYYKKKIRSIYNFKYHYKLHSFYNKIYLIKKYA